MGSNFKFPYSSAGVMKRISEICQETGISSFQELAGRVGGIKCLKTGQNSESCTSTVYSSKVMPKNNARRLMQDRK